MPRICTGYGECLMQTFDCNNYGKYPDMVCEHNCEPVKCPNFAMCENAGPKWYLGCHDGRCQPCNMFFGKNLTFKEEPEECPVCMETTLCVGQPNCSHAVCIVCFRRCRFNGPPRRGEPPFPYPDKEDEYFDTGNEPENPLYHDPLVVKYNRDWNRWEDAWQEANSMEENLRKCPICRS